MKKILLKNGIVWSGEKFYRADVLIQNDKILSVKKSITDEADFVFDAKGKLVSTGLVDLHVHFKGISNNDFGANAEMSTLPFGVTAAADASGVYGDKSTLEAFGVNNKVFVCAEFKNNRAYFENAKKMLKKYGNKAIGIKVYFDTEISEVSDISPLKEVIEFAQNNNIKVMVHSTNSPIPMWELLRALRNGDILTHAYHGGKNSVCDDGYRCIIEAKKRGVIIDSGFAGHVHTDFKVFENAVNCGAAPDVISTDITKLSAYKRGGRYGMTMCMSMAKTLGMNEEDIFKAVTSSPAKALGTENDWGYLKPGRKADISVLEYADEGFELCDNSGNIIKNKNGYRCVLTIFNGDIVYKR